MEFSFSILPSKIVSTSHKMSRKSFSIKEKHELINEFDRSALNQKDFAASKKISPSTLRTILKKRKEFVSVHEGTRRKKIRSVKYEELETILKNWFIQARSSHIPISGPILQERARQVAKSLGITDFTASTGWLDRFKTRHSIIYKQNCADSNSVNKKLATDWRNQILTLTTGYEFSEIYNAAEFGLFFKLMPDKSFALKHEKCHGGSLSKERLTVLVCTNMTGTDKKKPLVVGKYGKPRCLQNVKTLPCIYSSQSCAWMTGDCFKQWLHDWDNELKDRKILLLIENCAAHPKEANLKNIKLIFLPANTTSELQPLDQGIIKVLKQGYRRRMVQQYLSMMDSSTLPKTSILDAIHFLYAAWMDVKKETILNCFKKAGFGNFTGEQESEETNDESWQDLLTKARLPEMEGFDNFDNGLVTNEVLSRQALIDKHMPSKEKENEEEDETESSIITQPKIVDVLDALKTIRTFFVCSTEVEDKTFKNIDELENAVFEKSVVCVKQERIDEY